LLKQILDEPTTVVTTGRTADAYGLPEERRDALYARYGGTSMGRQELDAELIEDNVGALWKRSMIEMTRAQPGLAYTRIVVAIDPSATSTESADEAGIIVVGLYREHGYVLDDVSLRGTPAEWARAAVAAFWKWKADRIVAETNNGGEMVEYVLRSVDPSVPYTAVTASRGKVTRAEPISAFYEQGKVHHVGRSCSSKTRCAHGCPARSPGPHGRPGLALTDLMATSNPWAQLAGQRAGGVA
jgi:phage terminase large subunit-like protein